MDPQSLVILLRMVERILGVAIGGLLIYFGYRLFLDVRGRRGREGGSGDFTIAGGNKLKLSKVGPGVFFALFGAGLIVFSLTRSVSLTTTGAAAPPAGGAATGTVATVKFMGATSVPETDEDRVRRRTETQLHIVALNSRIFASGWRSATLRPRAHKARWNFTSESSRDVAAFPYRARARLLLGDERLPTAKGATMSIFFSCGMETKSPARIRTRPGKGSWRGRFLTASSDSPGKRGSEPMAMARWKAKVMS